MPHLLEDICREEKAIILKRMQVNRVKASSKRKHTDGLSTYYLSIKKYLILYLVLKK